MTEKRMICTLDVNGTAKNVTNEKIQLAVEFFAVRLMGRRLARNVGIEITFTKGLRRKQGVYGFCAVADDDRRPRYFDIEIDADMGAKATFEALAHEMVHVKQYCRGELQERIVASRMQTYWNGQQVDTAEADYWDLPWEIEAHGRERGLYLYLMDHFDKLQVA